MKIVTIIARILLGLVFVVFGLNGFIHKAGQMPPGPGGQFLTAMFQSHFVYAVCAFQIAGGLLLLIGRYVPLGLVILGPVIVNILLFHLFMMHMASSSRSSSQFSGSSSSTATVNTSPAYSCGKPPSDFTQHIIEDCQNGRPRTKHGKPSRYAPARFRKADSLAPTATSRALQPPNYSFGVCPAMCDVTCVISSRLRGGAALGCAFAGFFFSRLPLSLLPMRSVYLCRTRLRTAISA